MPYATFIHSVCMHHSFFCLVFYVVVFFLSLNIQEEKKKVSPEFLVAPSYFFWVLQRKLVLQNTKGKRHKSENSADKKINKKLKYSFYIFLRFYLRLLVILLFYCMLQCFWIQIYKIYICKRTQKYHLLFKVMWLSRKKREFNGEPDKHQDNEGKTVLIQCSLSLLLFVFLFFS